jgi:membrane protein implicated in regulation of membrane protease activity
MLVYFSFKWSLIALVVAFFLGKMYGKGSNSTFLKIMDMISLGTGRMLKPNGIEGTVMFLAGHIYALFAKLLILSLFNYSEWIAILTFFIFSVIFVWYTLNKLPEDRLQKELMLEQERLKGKTFKEVTEEGLREVRAKVGYSEDRFIGNVSDYENPFTDEAIDNAIFRRKMLKSNSLKNRNDRIEYDKEEVIENPEIEEQDNDYNKYLEERRIQDEEAFNEQRADQLEWIRLEEERENQERLDEQSLRGY